MTKKQLFLSITVVVLFTANASAQWIWGDWCNWRSAYGVEATEGASCGPKPPCDWEGAWETCKEQTCVVYRYQPPHDPINYDWGSLCVWWPICHQVNPSPCIGNP